MSSVKERLRALDSIVNTIEKTFGKGALMRLGEGRHAEVASFPSGSLGLDLALGVGGLPKGRLVEIFGPESSGKTTLALSAIAEVQRGGGLAAFIDAEHALDPSYAARLGVKLDELLLAQPDNGEQALEIAENLLRTGEIQLVVVDSVAALTPKAELDGEMGDNHVGLQARLMSQAMRKLASVAHHHNTTVLFINQIRMKIGVMFGSPETTTGGNALKFYASVRMDIRRKETLKDGDVAVGARTRVRVVKNKVAAPFREAEFDILYGTGICRAGELLDLGVQCGVIQRSGASYSYGDSRIALGREKAREALRSNADLARSVEAAIRGRGASVLPVVEPVPVEDAEEGTGPSVAVAAVA